MRTCLIIASILALFELYSFELGFWWVYQIPVCGSCDLKDQRVEFCVKIAVKQWRDGWGWEWREAGISIVRNLDLTKHPVVRCVGTPGTPKYSPDIMKNNDRKNKLYMDKEEKDAWVATAWMHFVSKLDIFFFTLSNFFKIFF